MKTNYIQYKDLIERQNFIHNLKRNRVKLLFRKNRFKVAVGVGCLIIAIIPNGTAPLMLPVGLGLLECNSIDMIRHKDNLLRRIRGFRIWN